MADNTSDFLIVGAGQSDGALVRCSKHHGGNFVTGADVCTVNVDAMIRMTEDAPRGKMPKDFSATYYCASNEDPSRAPANKATLYLQRMVPRILCDKRIESRACGLSRTGRGGLVFVRPLHAPRQWRQWRRATRRDACDDGFEHEPQICIPDLIRF